MCPTHISLARYSSTVDICSSIATHAGARFHDFHHYNFNGNYASTFVWWDWLFGTDKQWREFCAAKKQKQLKQE